MGFYEQVSGARMHSSFIRPGGLSRDVPLGFFRRLSFFMRKFRSRVDELDDLLSANRIWCQRLVGVGTVSKRSALTWGFSGVMLRGSGVP